MSQPKIWLSSPHMGGEELNYINEAFNTNWIAPLGPNVNGFEQDLCDYTGAKYSAVLSSGTSAIHLALIMLGVKARDEVICSSFTFSASANPIVYQRATPVFVDSENISWNMSPELLEAAVKDRISKGKKPKAIIAVHLYGNPSRIEEIMLISTKYDIPIIEDAAEALGSEYNGKKLGTYGLLGILSFNGNKIITTSAGGALISNKKDFIEKARFLSTQARDTAPHYQHSQIGYNYRMSNILAGIGRGQMKVIDQRVKQRRDNYNFYKEALSRFPGIGFQKELPGAFSNRWLTCITVDPLLNNGITRETVRLALEAENIESRPLWKPMHMQPVFKEYPYYGEGTSERLFEIGLCLPSGSNLTQADLDRVIEVIKTYIKAK
jgi:dTDP-4-amino-4,6-dideoxygalactose transaminase